MTQILQSKDLYTCKRVERSDAIDPQKLTDYIVTSFLTSFIANGHSFTRIIVPLKGKEALEQTTKEVTAATPIRKRQFFPRGVYSLLVRGIPAFPSSH